MKSRMKGDFQVRFRENAKVKFLCVTRQWLQTKGRINKKPPSKPKIVRVGLNLNFSIKMSKLCLFVFFTMFLFFATESNAQLLEKKVLKFNTMKVHMSNGKSYKTNNELWFNSEFGLLNGQFIVYFYQSGEKVADWGDIIKEESISNSKYKRNEYHYLIQTPTNSIRRYILCYNVSNEVNLVIELEYDSPTAEIVKSQSVFYNR